MIRPLLVLFVLTFATACTTTKHRVEVTPPTENERHEAQASFVRAVEHYEANGPSEDVLRDLEQVVKLDPAHASAWFNIGVVAEQLDHRARAREAYARAVKEDPTLGAPLVNLGMMAFEDGLHDEARQYMRRAASAGDGNVEAHRNQSELLRERGHLPAAVQSARRALQENASDPAAFVLLARAHFDGEAYEPAMFAANVALDLDPKHVAAHNLIGVIHWTRKDVTSALAAFEAAVAASPDDRAARMNLGAALLHVRNYDRATTQFRAVLEHAPLDSDAKVNLAVALRSSGELDDAQRLYEEVLDVDPKNAMAHFNLAVLEHEHRATEAVLGDGDHVTQAIEHYDRALSHYERAGELGVDVSARVVLVRQLKSVAAEQSK